VPILAPVPVLVRVLMPVMPLLLALGNAVLVRNYNKSLLRPSGRHRMMAYSKVYHVNTASRSTVNPMNGITTLQGKARP
jgi:hypothetical protein